MNYINIFMISMLYLSISNAFMLSTTTSSLRQTMRSQVSMMAKKKKEMPPNPVAVVTGASRGICYLYYLIQVYLQKLFLIYNNDNKGIGRAVALALGDVGCKVIVNYASNEAMALEVVEEIKARSAEKGGTAVAMKANIGNPQEIQAMFSKVVAEVLRFILNYIFDYHKLIFDH